MRFLPDPTDNVIFFDDFLSYTAGDWTITTTEAGAGSATEAVAAGTPNGILVVTNDAADNDADFFSSIIEAFQYTPGKRLRFKARFSLTVATLVGGVFGLCITDTTPEAVSDGIFFRLGEDAVLSLVCCKNGVESAVALATLANATFYTVEFVYDGSHEKIMAFINGEGVGSVPVTNAPDDEALAVTFGIRNGEAVAKVLNLDYVMAIGQR